MMPPKQTSSTHQHTSHMEIYGTKLVPVVLCGGSGTRMWPTSTKKNPKQLQPLVDPSKTMLQMAAQRFPASVCIAVTGSSIADQVSQQLLDVFGKFSDITVIKEPQGRNTAPALYVAARAAQKKYEPCLLVAMPSDHVMDDGAFQSALKKAVPLALDGKIVTMGVVPDKPETGFGYIESAGNEIVRFIEKPNLETAERLIQENGMYWNAGVFVFSPDTLIKEMQRHARTISMACDLALNTKSMCLDPHDWAKVPDESVDYAVMEHTKLGAIVPYDGKWSDVGSWPSLHDVLPKDSDGNTCRGKDIFLRNCKDTLVCNDEQRAKVAVIGLSNVCVVVSEHGGILVTSKAASQDVKHACKRFDS
jgi:mannose-1-phosphate guanylyltransferase/mannose-6-phosphate isomerase